MRKLLTICAVLIMSMAFCVSPASAAISYGTPSPSLSPIFGTLVDFDDQPIGTPVLAGDYASVGVASITELTGAGAAFARYGGSQSQPCYIGTGSGYEIGGASSGWDGTIRFDLAYPTSQIGLGIADSAGGPEIMTVYDKDGVQLESHIVNPGANVYAVITRASSDIARLEITGDFFAVDDLQFISVIEVAVDIKPGSCPNPFNGKSQGSVPVAILGTADFDVTTIEANSITLTGPCGSVTAMVEPCSLGDVSEPFGDPEDCGDCFDKDDPANFNCDLYYADGSPVPPGAVGDGVLDSYCGDGKLDMVVKFDTQELAAAIGPAERDDCVTLVLTGQTLDGTPIEGADSMVIKTKIKP